MAKRGKNLADDVIAPDPDGVQVDLLADEDAYDRRTLWRLVSWGVGAVGAVTIAVLANQFHIHQRQDRLAAADLARQFEHLQAVARESRNDVRRLAAAIDTLNSDRDRLYVRTTALEQGLESVTGSITRQNTPFSPLAASIPPLLVPDLKTTVPMSTPPASKVAATGQPQATSPAPSVETAGSTAEAAATQAMPTTAASAAPSSSDLTEPSASPSAKTDTTAPAPEVTASIHAKPAAAVEVAAPRTRFGVDLGAARSMDGLRALWRRLIAAHPSVLRELQPVIALRERRGTPVVELRLVAGPLDDAARAAAICAAITTSRHGCATTTFEGQQLATAVVPAAAPRPPHRRPNPHPAVRDKPAATSPPGHARSPAAAPPRQAPRGP